MKNYWVFILTFLIIGGVTASSEIEESEKVNLSRARRRSCKSGCGHTEICQKTCHSKCVKRNMAQDKPAGPETCPLPVYPMLGSHSNCAHPDRPNSTLYYPLLSQTACLRYAEALDRSKSTSAESLKNMKLVTSMLGNATYATGFTNGWSHNFNVPVTTGPIRDTWISTGNQKFSWIIHSDKYDTQAKCKMEVVEMSGDSMSLLLERRCHGGHQEFLIVTVIPTLSSDSLTYWRTRTKQLYGWKTEADLCTQVY